ncbi:MAG: hypothetical protein ACLFU9_02705 [Candidatus Bathyarchaeia archaeon]
MSAKRDEPKTEARGPEKEKINSFGAKMYLESAKAVRQVGARVVLSIGAAILIWLFGTLVFIPIAGEIQWTFLDKYPLAGIVSFIFVIAMALIIFSVFVDVRKLTSGVAGVLAYQFGKASGEVSMESYNHYRIALDGILYVFIVVLAYLLFANYLAQIHTAIPAILLILIAVWSIFALWRSAKAIAAEIGKYTGKMANEIEKLSKE